MGKKQKGKGKGAEKTAAKTEKKMSARLRRDLALTGEEDIEKIVSQIEEEERKKVETKEIHIDFPSRRVNFGFVAHPEKDELILFGGEFFNGQKTQVYNDLLFYNIHKNDWSVLKAPGAPPPRSGHQMVVVPTNKGQLWIFGGEFTNESENQFYHYKDLWVFHLLTKQWEKINAPTGPSPRSGHRMCLQKKQLFVFGGYHDNAKEYKYFNDVYIFNLEDYKWKKLEPIGTPPTPRSACQMVPLPDGKILISGGYSKKKTTKKDVDEGIVHTDSFCLAPDKTDPTKWKWSQVKLGGLKISPRSGATIVVAPGNKAYAFGGVFDVEKDDEDIDGTFFNELNCLDLEKKIWRTVTLSGKKGVMSKQEGDTEQEAEMDVEQEEITVADDGVFKVTVGPSLTTKNASGVVTDDGVKDIFIPSPRMNCGLAVKRSVLYLFGGLVEEDEKQITFADFYSLDLHKFDEWKVIQTDSEAAKDWIAPESSSEEDDDDDDSDGSDDDEEEMDTD